MTLNLFFAVYIVAALFVQIVVQLSRPKDEAYLRFLQRSTGWVTIALAINTILVAH